MSHVLEHIVNPNTFMQKCSKLNSKYFFIEVPALVAKIIDEPYGLFFSEHVNHFSFESLQRLMNNNGYTLVKIDIVFYHKYYKHPQCPAMRTLWKKSNEIKTAQPLFTSKDLLQRYMEVSNKYLDKICNKISSLGKDKKVALWGAGSTLFRLLENTNIKELNLLRVYDLDPAKMDLSINGLNILNFEPSDIENGTIDTIILTTNQMYHDEIRKILEPYKNKIEIINLFDF